VLCVYEDGVCDVASVVIVRRVSKGGMSAEVSADDGIWWSGEVGQA
jgi:hypothetical protein